MKYWSDIVQASLYKLFIDENDEDSNEYTNKMPIIANECLSMIANDIKPCLKGITLSVYNFITEGSNFVLDGDFVVYDGIREKAREDMLYITPTTRYIYKNKELLEVIDTIYSTEIYKMPNDFISFAENSPIKIEHRKVKTHPTEIVYVDWNKISIMDKGTYTIYYNASYGVIPKDIGYDNLSSGTWNDFDLTKSYTADEYNEYFEIGISGKEIVFNGISSSVLDCLPTYIASALLAQDDLQRSAILRNEFETMAQRLDTHILFENESFTSPGGWY